MSLQYRETIDYLYGLKRLGIRPGLHTMKGLISIPGSSLGELPVVHIAGTNGKGSTSAMIASVMSEAGYRAGLYTSPHLVRFNERFKIGDKDISDEALCRVAAKALDTAEKLKAESGLEATFFEIATLMAILYFSEQDVDIAIMETGMGGRLDATNALTPIISVITGVAHDHSAYLGHSIEEIAAEKAGIIKKGVPLISGVTEAAPARVIEDRAKALNKSRPLRLGRDFRYTRVSGGSFDYYGLNLSLKGVESRLRGGHQQKNAAIALAVLESLQGAYPAVNETAMREGLRKVNWPGRFESVSCSPRIILDCAHNPEGASALAEAIKEYFPPPATMTLIAGISGDKDISGILSRLVPLARRVILTEARIERAAALRELRKAARVLNKDCEEEPSVELAVGRAMKSLPAHEIIVISGSIFVVGEARGFLCNRRSLQEREGACGSAAIG